MEQIPASPELAAMVAREQAALEGRIRASGLPLVGLAEPAPPPRMLGVAATCDGVTESVGLAYGDPMHPDGPLVQVHCARWPSRWCDRRSYTTCLSRSWGGSGTSPWSKKRSSRRRCA